MKTNKDLDTVIEHLRETERILANSNENGHLSTIDKDLALEKIRRAYEKLHLYTTEKDTQNNYSTPVEQSPPQKGATKPSEVDNTSKPNIEEEAKQQEDKPIGPEASAQSTSIEGIPKEPEILTVEVPEIVEVKVDDPIPQGSAEQEGLILEQASQEKKTSKSPQEESIPEQSNGVNGAKHAQEILANKFEGTKKFRNETFNVNRSDVSSKLQNKPIEDLTKAIGINDKFLYTKELFDGNAELYATTVRKLNEFTDINEALFYIQDNFSWEQNNEAANQLIDLVRRKLLKS